MSSVARFARAGSRVQTTARVLAQTHTRALGSAAAKPAVVSAATPSAGASAEHKAWLADVSKYPIVIPRFEWTLEWILPTPIPMHQFEQSPIVLEVADRNPNPDDLTYHGPNVVAGYLHPVTGKKVSREEHAALLAKTAAAAPKADAAHHH